MLNVISSLSFTIFICCFFILVVYTCLDSLDVNLPDWCDKLDDMSTIVFVISAIISVCTISAY